MPLYVGDLGPSTQKFTSFLPLDGIYKTDIVGVEACCIGNSCLKQTNFRALIDGGTSFTFLPDEVYEKITKGGGYACQDLSDGKRMPLASPTGMPSNPLLCLCPLPTNEQQSTPGGHAVAPAVAGRAPSKPVGSLSLGSVAKIVFRAYSSCF
ncbi:aspartic proteinase-like protein 1 [Carya illinoinensis]|uniref:aspartic proteinase-like protein 1 n=1 Tax=Carya illinoinensis TaxID=32201 RepID=UPI001C720028|nr:aspartic proteinase-like protein 1 [Carya illinoinensis]